MTDPYIKHLGIEPGVSDSGRHLVEARLVCQIFARTCSSQGPAYPILSILRVRMCRLGLGAKKRQEPEILANELAPKPILSDLDVDQ